MQPDINGQDQWDIFRSPDGQYFADSMNVCSAFPIWLSLGVDMLLSPLLRPACEELIWAKYLATIDKGSANELLLCLAQKEIHDSLVAQDGYLGRTATKEAGLLIPLERLTHHLPEIRRRLAILGNKLRWPKKFIEKGAVPSIAWLAKETGNTKMYNFLYHAASRYVHFSMGELLRRAWGSPAELTIRSANFGEYWSSFTLAWGLRLLSDTYLAMHEYLEADGVIDPGVSDGSKIMDAYKRIAEFGLVPIITRAELNWKE